MVPVVVVTGTIGDGGIIPLPTGYTDAQCQWLVAGSTDETYDRDACNYINAKGEDKSGACANTSDNQLFCKRARKTS